MKGNTYRRPLCWLLPLLFALPFAAAVLFVLLRWGSQIADVLNVALKTVVIP